MREHNEHELPEEIARAVALIRDEPTMDPRWRAEVLRRTAGAGYIHGRRLSLSVRSALAAAAIFMLTGAGLTLLLARRPPATAERIAALESSAAPTLPVRFSVVAPEAAKVTIVGDFNQWNPMALPMRRSIDGRLWEIEVRLPLGRYSYAFLIDGKLAPDPAAPRGAGDDFGAPNSVLMVRGS